MDKNSEVDEQKVKTDPFFSPTIQFIIKGEHLPSPFYLKLYQNSFETGNNWVLFHVTPTHNEESQSAFTQQIKLQYNFATNQFILIEVWKTSLEYSKLHASSKFSFSQLLRSPTHYIDLFLEPSQEGPENLNPSLKVFLDGPVENKDLLTLTFSAKLTKKFIFAPKTYFTLWKSLGSSSFTKVLQSLPTSGKNPLYAPIQVKVSNQFKKSGTLRVVVHENSDNILGLSEFTYADVVELQKKNFGMFRFEKKKKEDVQVTDQGILELVRYRLDKAMTFTEYLNVGLELQHYPIIDFSMFCGEGEINDDIQDRYKDVLRLISESLGNYSSDSDIVSFGVGAQTQQVEDEDFFLLKEAKNTVTLLDEFKNKAKNVKEKKEVVLFSLVREILERIKAETLFATKPKYYVCSLVISSDIQDIQQVIDRLHIASFGVPISFLFIEIGEHCAHLASSQALKAIKTVQVRPGSRTNINSVCLEEYPNEVEAIKDLLEAVPKQIWTFFNKLDIFPNNFCSNEVCEKYRSLSNHTHVTPTDEIGNLG